MNAEELKKFARIRDVVLWESNFIQPNDYLEFESLKPQSRHRLDRCETYTLEERDGADARTMLRAYCEFAIRAVGVNGTDASKDSGSSESVPVLFQIEATFALVFETKKEFDKKEADSFFMQSCTHICWPFWRQHVFDTLKRASLPMLSVPIHCPAPIAGDKGLGNEHPARGLKRVKAK